MADPTVIEPQNTTAPPSFQSNNVMALLLLWLMKKNKPTFIALCNSLLNKSKSRAAMKTIFGHSLEKQSHALREQLQQRFVQETRKAKSQQETSQEETKGTRSQQTTPQSVGKPPKTLLFTGGHQPSGSLVTSTDQQPAQDTTAKTVKKPSLTI